MGNIKQINTKNYTYYFFEDFNPSLIKIDKKSYKNIAIYHIGYITKKNSDHVKINSVNTLHLIIGEVYGYIEGSNANKYLLLVLLIKTKKC